MTEDEQNKPEQNQGNPGYEVRDVDSLYLIKGMLIVLVIGLVIHVILGGMIYLFYVQYKKANIPLSPLEQVREVPPEPRLQPDPPADLRAMLDREAVLLNGYGWIDRKKGIVRIPVERALDLIAQKGMPPRLHSPATTSTLNVRLSGLGVATPPAK